jgi:hypothetical protein
MTGILGLVNLLLPVVSNVVLLVKNQNGTTTAIIASAETATADDQAQIEAWIHAHGGTSSTPTS